MSVYEELDNKEYRNLVLVFQHISFKTCLLLLYQYYFVKESNIYSVGMLMWEIFAGQPPFDDRAHGFGLSLKICEGQRSPLLSNMPADYMQMMQKCWNVNPSKRPTIKELLDFADNKLKEIYENENLEIGFIRNTMIVIHNKYTNHICWHIIEVEY